MKNSCFICPVNFDKFNYAENLLDSYNKFYDDDLFLIFSDELEAKLFKEKNINKKYKEIISNITDEQGIISKKKFFGLNYIFSNTTFEKVGVIDCDSIFIKNIDYDNCFKNFYNNKKIYATTVNDHEFFLKFAESSLIFFNDFDKEKIKNKTNNLSLYFWFNEVPIYDKKDYCEFLEYIDYKN